MAEGEPKVTAVDVLDGNGHLPERKRDGYTAGPTPARRGSFVPPRGPAQRHVFPRGGGIAGHPGPRAASPEAQTPRRLWERDSTVRGPSRLRRRGYSQDLTAEVPVLKAAVFTVGPSKASEFPSRRRGPALGRAKAFWLRPVVEAHAASKQSRSPTPTSDIRFRIRAPGVRAGVHHTSAGCIMARGGHAGGAGPACPAVSST